MISDPRRTGIPQTSVSRVATRPVRCTGDSNRRAPTAARVIHGSDKVARFVLGLAARYGPKLFEVGQLALVNGELGLYNERVDTDGEWPELQPHIQALTVRDGKVCAIWDVANPDKFTASPLAGQKRRQSMAPGTRPPN